MESSKAKTLSLVIEGIFNLSILALMVWFFVSFTASEEFQKGLYEWAKRPYTAKERFNATIFTCGLASFLYLTKRHEQLYYGLLETAFAIAVCIISVDTVHDSYANNTVSNSTWIGFASALYLMVRGATNINEGWGKGNYLLKRMLRGDKLHDE